MQEKEVKPLVGMSQMKNRMKQYLASDVRLSKEAVQVMAKNINDLFESVMWLVGELPYKDVTGYVVSQEFQKFLAKTKGGEKNGL